VPHHEREARFVFTDQPRYVACLGGEGSGKSVSGTIKTLERLRRGMHGILVSPDLEHFKKSLWREFTLWCPWHMVTARYQYMSAVDWQPSEPFILTFVNGAQLICGGIKEDQVGSWEGPNVHFFHFDEARRHKTAAALKVLTGRIRLTGPNGEPPQGWITSTPRKHWLYEYFGPWDKKDAPDPRAEFKKRAAVVRLRTLENQQNLDAEYVEARRSSLNESEARVVLNAEWEDEQDSEAFLESMILWDACRVELPPLRRNEPMVLAMDAGISSDTFSIVGVTGMPGQRGKLAVRYVQQWIPQNGIKLDFDPIEEQIELICKQFAVTKLVYDPYQLHQMGTRLMTKGIVFTEAFNQGPRREQADKGLLDLILARRLLHDGNEALRQAVANADRRITGDSVQEKKLRIVKRSQSLKIDPLVAAGMACDEALKLGLDQ
jgi:phage terminase large subunit